MHRISDLLIIGGGNMGGAIALASARAGLGVAVVEPNSVAYAELSSKAAATPAGTLDVHVELRGALARVAPALRAGTACVVLAVKPQVFPSVAPELAAALAADREDAATPAVLSIMAGVTTRAIEHALPGTRVLRAMPNLGAVIGRSTTALCAGVTAEPDDLDVVGAILAHFGSVEPIDESLMDAFTALAGSGPAFLFYLAEAMARGGNATGFDSAQARRIVATTLDAAANLLLNAEPRLDAHAWRARVTSKKGTTQAAIESLDAEDVMNAVVRALVAGRDRGRAIGSVSGGLLT